MVTPSKGEQMPTKTPPKSTKAKAAKPKPDAEPAPSLQTALVPPAGPHIIADRDELLRVARLAAQWALAKSSLPVLNGVKLDLEVRGDATTLVVAASDLETFFVTETDNVAGKEAHWIVSAHLFAQLLEDLAPGRVTITADDSRIYAEGQPVGKGRMPTKFSLVQLSYEDFPAIPEIEGNECEVDAAELAQALAQVVPAISKDNTQRPYLTGALFASKDGTLRIDATDSYRLATRAGVAIKCAGPDIRAIVPGSFLSRLPEPEGTCRIVLGENQARVDVGRTRVTTRLIEGQYPDVEQLVPATFPYRLTTSKAGLRAAVKAAARLAKGNVAAHLNLGDEPFITAEQKAVADAAQPFEASYDGPERVLGVNPLFFLDGIEALPNDQVLLELQEDTDPDNPKALLIRDPEDESFTYLLMPVRLWK